MGCCTSKNVCSEIYVEMLRRLSVEPIREVNTFSSAKRTSEFEKIASSGKINNDSKKNFVSIEQLQQYNRVHWQLSSVHPYNEILLIDTVEDFFRYNNLKSKNSSNELGRCDYRPWLLSMCEFYRIMGVFEKMKLLKNGNWEKIFISENELNKSLNTLTSEFSTAFVSDKGPGSSFKPANSASANAIIRQVQNWYSNPLKPGIENNGVSTQSIQLIKLVHWLVIRHVNTLRCEEDKTFQLNTTEVSISDTNIKDDGILKMNSKWKDKFLQKQVMIERFLKNPTLLEELFNTMTHGSQKLSETDAKKEYYQYFVMSDLFKDQSIHDNLVEIAFRTALQGDNRNVDSCIDNNNLFGNSLQVYSSLLELYYKTIMIEATQHGTDPKYGLPVPDLEQDLIVHVLRSMKSNESNENKVNNLVSHLISTLTIKEGDTRRVSFIDLANLWAKQSLLQTSKFPINDLSELFQALGLGNYDRRKAILSILIDNGWNSNESKKTFNAIKTELNLPKYCNTKDFACDCASKQWINESEGREVITVNLEKEKDNSLDIDHNHILADIQLMRLLYGVYGTFTAVNVLEKNYLPESNIIENNSNNNNNNNNNSSTLGLMTPISFEVRLNVLKEVGNTLEIPNFHTDTDNEDILENQKEEININKEETLSNTAFSLVQYISQSYVNDQMIKYKRAALSRLREVWPIFEDDVRQDVFFQDLTQGCIGENFTDSNSANKEFHRLLFDKLYQKYASDILLIMSKDVFYEVCHKGLSHILENGEVSLTVEDFPSFLRYITGYMHALVSLGVSNSNDNFSRKISTKLSWAELENWLFREAEIVMDESIKIFFKERTATGSDDVSIKDVVEWFALREARWTPIETRLFLWINKIKDKFPIRNTMTDKKLRKTIAKEISESDNYILTESLIDFFFSQYKLLRVWSPELGNSFITMCVFETNKILQREDLEGNEIHCSDFLFLLLYIYTYLDVFLHGECMMKTASKMITSTSESLDDKDRLIKASSILWSDIEMRERLNTLLKDIGINEDDFIYNIMQDINEREKEILTTAQFSNAVAREIVTAALSKCLNSRKIAIQNGRIESMWDRLQQRLPTDDSKEHRLQRKKLFASMDLKGRQFLTFDDLHRGMVDILGLDEFRKDLHPILLRSFIATKEVTFGTHESVYLTGSNEEILTASELRSFLWYVNKYFEIYYMFDVLCESNNNKMKRAVSSETFVASSSLFKKWGFRIDDPIATFASINRRCREGVPMYFTGFAEWASLHHLTPSGYSHEEIDEVEGEEEEEEEENEFKGLKEESMGPNAMQLLQ